MEKCRYIGKQFFIYDNVTLSLNHNKYYYYIKKTYFLTDENRELFSQYEIYDNTKFITIVSIDIFKKQFINLKQERKLKLEKLNENR